MLVVLIFSDYHAESRFARHKQCFGFACFLDVEAKRFHINDDDL